LGSNPVHRWIEGGKEARTQKRERSAAERTVRSLANISSLPPNPVTAWRSTSDAASSKLGQAARQMTAPLAPDHH
jgi:hypothetical protein